MLTSKQMKGLAVGLGIASVAAMGLVAVAALTGLSERSLSAISTVISTGFAAAAIVASLGLVETARDGTAPGSDGQPSPIGQTVASYAVDGQDDRVEVDPSTGRVFVAFRGVTIELKVRPDRLSIIDQSAGRPVSGSSSTPAGA